MMKTSTQQFNALIRQNSTALLTGVVVLAGLYMLSRENYLLFHTLSELFSIVIGLTIFVLTWNARKLINNGYLVFLGISLLFVSLFDLLHTLAFRGMGVFPSTAVNVPNAPNLATQLWLVARYVQAASLVVAPFFLRRKLKTRLVMIIYALVSAFLFLAIAWKIFPMAYLDNGGLTKFKVVSEYVIIFLFVVGMLGLLSIREAFDQNLLSLMTVSIALSIVAEMAFTDYLNVNDFANLIGHFFKIAAFYLIYKAIVETGFVRPQELLYHDLAASETALRASEARERARALQLEAIMDVVPAIVWIAHDRNSRDVSGNRASAELLGLPPNANHSRYNPQVSERFKFYDKDGNLLVPETYPLHRVAATGKAVRDFEETVVDANGAERHLYGNITPLLDEAGQPGGAVGAFIDITERVHAEQALQESERRYRTLFETMAEGFMLHELVYDEHGRAVDSRLVEVNPALEQILGMSSQELVGKRISELSPQGSIWVERYARSAESGQPARYEDFSTIAQKYLEVMVSPISPTSCAVILVDVTERRNSQEALRQSEARLRRLVDSNIIGIMYADAQGDITLANDALLDIIGYSRAELEAGQVDWRAMTPAEYLPLDEAHIMEANERGACTPYEKEYIRKDGERVPVLIGFAYFAGAASPYICFVLNLTQQKRAEAAVSEYAAQLERINHELERANGELQDFAFVASHDLQEPLRKIQAFGERLNARLNAQLNEETRDYMERMLNASARMRAMINDLLALSRVTTQGRPFQKVNLNDVAQEVVSDLEMRVERTNGRVEVGDLPTIEADPLQMHQLFQNLIGNALKFHRVDVSPVVKVWSECSSDDQQVTVFVEDNGIGFESEYLERIFQPFQRLHGMGEYEGSGMGLAIVRKIAERHAGTVTAHSVPGQGSTFEVTLPIRQPVRKE